MHRSCACFVQMNNNLAFQRDKKRLSKKEKKKKEAMELEHKQAEKVPESSFTRTISNPDLVMARRRKQKLEQKLESVTRNGDPNAGNTWMSLDR